MADPMSCVKCGAPHTRCSAHNKAGKACGGRPISGSTVCRLHGGSAPQVKARAAERVVEEKLRRSLGDLVAGRKGVSVSQAYQEALELSSGAVDAVLQKLADEDDLSPELAVAVQKLASEHARVAKLGLDAGVAERQVAVQEEQLTLLGTALGAAMKAAELTDEQRAAFTTALREHLG